MRRPVAPVENLRPGRQRAKDTFIAAPGQRFGHFFGVGPGAGCNLVGALASGS